MTPSSQETWRPIAGHEGYEASDRGGVRSWRARGGVRRSGPKMLRPTRAKRPLRSARKYLYVSLANGDGTFAKRYVHRLVLEAFVGPCPEGLECRHGDGDPENNDLGNLCWGTALENAADRARHGTAWSPSGLQHGSVTKPERVPRGERAKHVLSEVDVRSLRLTTDNHEQAAARVGVSSTQVSRIRRRLQWKHVS